VLGCTPQRRNELLGIVALATRRRQEHVERVDTVTLRD